MHHHIDVTQPPLRPLMGGSSRLGYGLRLSVICWFACCYWLLCTKVWLRAQAYDLCGTSFLRGLTANSSSAFSIWWVVFALRHCSFQLHLWVFVVSTGQLSLAAHESSPGRLCDVNGVVHHTSIIITWCRVAFWVCVFGVAFVQSSASCFLRVLQKTRLTSSLRFFNWFFKWV